jgi:hypothetical protein
MSCILNRVGQIIRGIKIHRLAIIQHGNTDGTRATKLDMSDSGNGYRCALDQELPRGELCYKRGVVSHYSPRRKCSLFLFVKVGLPMSPARRYCFPG